MAKDHKAQANASSPPTAAHEIICLALRHKTASLQLAFYYMKGKRNLIRQFVKSVDWVTPANIAYLLEGRYDSKIYQKYFKELEEMTITRHGALRKIKNGDGMTGFTSSEVRNHIPTYLYNHDVALRNCVARFLFDRGHQGIGIASVKRIKGNPDAHIGNVYFEFDNGGEGTAELSKKINRYNGDGRFRVIFFMKNRDNAELDHTRLNKLFEIIKKVMKKKPNRILGACYTQYLQDGKVYNLRGESTLKEA